MTERLKEMMSSVLADLADLPQKVTDAGWTGEDDAAPARG